MKAIFLALALFTAVANPGASVEIKKGPEGRFLDVIISNAVESIGNLIREKGLDPYVKEEKSFSFKLPVTDLLKIDAALENLVIKGMSNIVINNIDFSIIFLRLRFDIAMPEISFSLDSAEASIAIASKVSESSISGSLVIENMRLQGEVDVGISVITGIGIQNIDIKFTLQSVESNLNINLLGRDVSKPVNVFLGEIIPFFFKENQNAIGELLGHIIKLIADRWNNNNNMLL